MSAVVLTHRSEHVPVVRPRPQRILPSHMVKHSFGGGHVETPKITFCDQPEQSDLACTRNSPLHVILQSESPAPDEAIQVPEPKTSFPEHFSPQNKPKLIRPVPLKVARPIPRDAVEEFYDASYRQGIQAKYVHEASALAYDWHRKWTQQDEEGHTMPEPTEDDPCTFHGSERVWEANPTMYDTLDRYSGARNPSPEEFRRDPFSERKRLRITPSGSVSSLSPDSGDDEEEVPHQANALRFEPPNSKRRVFGDLEFVPMEDELGGWNQQSGLLRPVALRIPRPQAVNTDGAWNMLANAQMCYSSLVPSNIQDMRSQHSSLSPLTLPSISSSHRKSEPAVIEEDEIVDSSTNIPCEISHVSKRNKANVRPPEVETARNGVLRRLAVTGGDVVKDEEFLNHLTVLKEFFHRTDVDTRFTSESENEIEGKWLTLTKPTFFGNLGNNDDGDPMYTLGRMSFDMFSPTRLVCSLQGNFNFIETVTDEERPAMLDTVPKALREEVESGETTLRTYNIVTALTIEPHIAAWPNAPNKDVRRPIRGIMTTTGYILPDPETPNRNSVWITGGRIEPNDDLVDQQEWNRQFGKNPPKHGFGEHAKLLAVKLLMGATIPEHMAEDGTMEYTFQRPLGGHGLAYVDTLYVDESLRIVEGHRGTIFVFSKLSNTSKTT